MRSFPHTHVCAVRILRSVDCSFVLAFTFAAFVPRLRLILILLRYVYRCCSFRLLVVLFYVAFTLRVDYVYILRLRFYCRLPHAFAVVFGLRLPAILRVWFALHDCVPFSRYAFAFVYGYAGYGAVYVCGC